MPGGRMPGGREPGSREPGSREPGSREPGRPISRRGLLQGAAALGAGAALTRVDRVAEAVATLPVARVRKPGSRPNPRLPEGTDTLPKIEHIVVVMQENHSFDNYIGMLGRGDGFKLTRKRVATASNPDADGSVVHAFHMPTTCQLRARPSQAWDASHISFNGGKNDGFVRASGPVAMGYWTAADLPFYYGLARTFPLADRWFASCMAQTYPNRRFLMAGTAAGITRTDSAAVVQAPPPPNGTIFDRLNAHGISWKDYATDLPQVALFPKDLPKNQSHVVPIDAYFTDAAAGALPSFSLVDANFTTGGSEENPQDIGVGEEFVSRVVNAAMTGKGWAKTLLIWCYDEHGGYYDHVPPPRAIKPDDIPPDIHVPPQQPGGYDRYGFRVPAVVVSPYAKKRYVSHVVHDHTSVLKLVETKWNLPAMTYRDANADNLLDLVDFKHRPAFLEPPTLPKPGLVTDPTRCQPGDAGTIPPPGSVTPAR
jgi:phospholipase C